MKVWIAVAIAGLCVCQPALAQKVVRSYPAQLRVDLDTEGHVAGAKGPDDLPSMLEGPMQQAIRRWRFKPVQRDGHPVTARTFVRARLEVVEQAAGKYGLRLVYEANGPRLGPGSYVPKGLPMSVFHAGVEGRLVMDAIVHPDGSIADVTVAEAKIPGVRIAPFRQFAIDVVEHMEAEPEQVDGKPIATHVRIPFVFQEPTNVHSPAELKKANENPTPPPPGGGAVAMDSPVVPLDVAPPG